MQKSRAWLSKQREAIQSIYRFQIGLRANNAVELAQLQERITNAFLFEKIPYFNTQVSVDEPVGFFDVDLMAVAPMPAADINKHSERHKDYFELESENI